MGLVVRRLDVYLVGLDPTEGSEVRKSRPCLIVSPDEMKGLRTVIVVPMTTKRKPYPTRIPVRFQGVSGYVAADQIRTVDKARLTKRLGRLHTKSGATVLAMLREMFAE